jgi:hypothetical protein
MEDARGWRGESAAPHDGGEELDRVGRAWRFAIDEARELWRMPRDAERLARRLVMFGEASLGGFTSGGIDGGGAWLVRRRASKRLDAMA